MASVLILTVCIATDVQEARIDMTAFPAHKYPVEHLISRDGLLVSAAHKEGFVWQHTTAGEQ